MKLQFYLTFLRWRSSSASNGTRKEDHERKFKDKNVRRSLVLESQSGEVQKTNNKSKKTSLKDKKKKGKERDRPKNVGFAENNDTVDSTDTKSLGSICFVIDTEKDTLSVISGNSLITKSDQ